LGSRDRCQGYSGLPEGFGRHPKAGMVAVPGGRFEPGSRQGYADERPAGLVTVAPFWMDRTEVTNAQFAAFVEATGYRTVAERPVDAARHAGLPPELSQPGALVFSPPNPAGPPAAPPALRISMA
jgi:formylglycine-generating enzyme required for sulfatase activity